MARQYTLVVFSVGKVHKTPLYFFKHPFYFQPLPMSKTKKSKASAAVKLAELPEKGAHDAPDNPGHHGSANHEKHQTSPTNTLGLESGLLTPGQLPVLPDLEGIPREGQWNSPLTTKFPSRFSGAASPIKANQTLREDNISTVFESIARSAERQRTSGDDRKGSRKTSNEVKQPR